LQTSEASDGYDDRPIADWLVNSLGFWLTRFVTKEDFLGNRRPNVELLLYMERVTRATFVTGGNSGAVNTLYTYLFQHPRVLWHVIDEILGQIRKLSGYDADAHVAELASILLEAGAPYAVERQGGQHYLRRRVPAAVETITKKTQDSVEQSSELLQSAFKKTYGRQPDFSQAYGLCIKAVEMAAIPALIPNDTIGTLGKAIGHLRCHKDEWALVFHDSGTQGVDVVLGMLELLWKGQSDRHGGSPPPTSITREEAEAALQLASTLVYWFGRAGLRHTSG